MHSSVCRCRPLKLVEVIFAMSNTFGLFMSCDYFNGSTFCFLQTLAATHMEDKELSESIQKLLIVMQRLDHKIAPLLESDGELFNKRFCSVVERGLVFIVSRSEVRFKRHLLSCFRWGYLSRAGLWDKSHIMRQIEKY